MISQSTQQTRELGARLAQVAKPGDIFALTGDLGTGKTEFVRGFVHELSADAQVRSPTFSIVNTYRTGRFAVFHFDFYRLSDCSELEQIGFDEYVSSDGVCLIEWADMFIDVLPENTRVIRFSDCGKDAREIVSDFSW